MNQSLSCCILATVGIGLLVSKVEAKEDEALDIPAGVVPQMINIHNNTQPNPFMDFYLRMPADWKMEANNNPSKTALRVLLMCPYRHTQQNVSKFLADPRWTAFADKNHLALLTANVGKLKIDINNRHTCYYYPESYSGQALLHALEAYRKKGYPLMTEGMLLHGISAGAQWAHRLVLWKPKMALGVSCHVGSFYDLPKPSDKGAAWLISTGFLDSNSLEQSRAFYLESRKRGLPCVLKVFPTLGHESSAASEDLSRDFFQTLLDGPILADRDKALAAYATSTNYGYVRTNEVYPKQELTQFQADEWFCPVFTRSFADAWKRNK